MSTAQLTKQQIKDALWAKGNLEWKITHAEYQGKVVNHVVQKEMYDEFVNAEENSTLVWLLSRQTGKSFLLAIIATMTALSKNNAIIKLLTDTKVHAETIFIPIFNEIFMDCPEYLKPHYAKSKYTYTFPNGSQIQLAGSDNGHYERLRGQTSDLVLIDEAGFCDNLKYIVRSVLIPTTTHTGGKVILASTPSADPNHEFVDFIEEAEMNGTLIRKTLFDNPLLNDEKKANIVQKMGGITNSQFRREYLCEIIKDETNSVFPEFDENLKQKIVRDWEKPVYYDSYVGMDIGGKDLTAVIFLYYDFRNDKVIVEDELVYSEKEMTIPKLTQDILDKEKLLWMNPLTNEKMGPRQRISDINYIVTREISKLSNYELHFRIPKKDDKQMAVNNLRVLLEQEKIIINPRCETLIRHLDNCKWKNTSTVLTFARSPDDGHYDTVDALIYAIRSIEFKRNPYPAGYELDLKKEDIHIQNPDGYSQLYNNNNSIDVFKKLFKK